MQLFRKLAGNIFFKIILGMVALSFVLFGISGFILGSPNSWVAKVGKTTIGINAFNKALQGDREAILASSKSEEAMKYLDSNQFKSDVLGRMVNRLMIETLHQEMGVEASRTLILEAVSKDLTFKNKDGKFDRELFKKFLAKNGLNEERYINEIANDITATMILQTMSMAAPLNNKIILDAENFQQEKRLADVVLISLNDVKETVNVSDEEAQKFFTDNKNKYDVPEMRKVSYIHFSKKDFAKDFAVSEEEVAAEYEKNKDSFLKPEARSFYHILFEKEEAANDFLQKLDTAAKADKSKLKGEFQKLAKDIQGKDLKAITLSQVLKKDFILELSDPTFKLALNEHSAPIKSPLGFHVFLLTEVAPARPYPLAEVKNSVKQRMSAEREEKIIHAKISEIDDMLLTTNSLAEVAQKFNLTVTPAVKISQSGQNENGEPVNETKGFDSFAENTFALKQGQASKIFYAKNSEGFYALQVEEVTEAHSQEFAEIKAQVVADLTTQKKLGALEDLAQKIGDEIKQNPTQVVQIAAKHKVKIEKNSEFPRVFFLNLQGRQMAYPSKFLDELFSLKINQATSVLPAGDQEFSIGVLREIKKPATTSTQFEQAKQKAAEAFRTEVLQEYNAFLLKINPVQVNEKLLKSLEKQEEVQQ